MEGADAIVGIVAAGILVWMTYGPWQMTCTDRARCTLFILRDRLFDIAADGRLSFESAEYRETRMALNLMIRFAHRLTAPRLIVMMFFRSRKQEQAGLQISKLIAAIPDDTTRREVGQIFVGAMDTTFAMVRLKSPFLSLIYVAVFLVSRCYQIMAHRSFASMRLLYQYWRNKSAELMLSGAFYSEI